MGIPISYAPFYSIDKDPSLVGCYALLLHWSCPASVDGLPLGNQAAASLVWAWLFSYASGGSPPQAVSATAPCSARPAPAHFAGASPSTIRPRAGSTHRPLRPGRGSRPGRDVPDVSDPELIRSFGHELPLHQVHPLQPRSLHQASDPFTAHEDYPRSSVPHARAAGRTSSTICWRNSGGYGPLVLGIGDSFLPKDRESTEPVTSR